MYTVFTTVDGERHDVASFDTLEKADEYVWEMYASDVAEYVDEILIDHDGRTMIPEDPNVDSGWVYLNE